MTNSSSGQARAIPSHPIRVFIVDDDVSRVDAVERTINKTPQGDMVFVGSHLANTEDLPERVKDSEADVVIVDVVLEYGASPDIIRKKNQPKEWNGIEAVRTLRNALAQRIKIIVWTHWKFRFEREAFAAGADDYRFKNLSNDELRSAIRAVTCGAPTRSSSYPRISVIELVPKTRAVTLKSDTGESACIFLNPPQSGFLYYVALERLQRKPTEPGWLLPVPHSGHGGGLFKIRKYDLWIEANEASGYDSIPQKAEVGEIVEVTVLSKHCAIINRAVSDHFGAGVNPLIIGPRQGGSYTLNPRITPGHILIS
jgi:DNA-binding NarL/FixJ family response regulator